MEEISELLQIIYELTEQERKELLDNWIAHKSKASA